MSGSYKNLTDDDDIVRQKDVFMNNIMFQVKNVVLVVLPPKLHYFNHIVPL